MPQSIYKAAAVLLVLSLATYSIELSFITSFFVILICVSKWADNKLLISTLFLTIVTGLGFLSSITFEYPLFDFVKDAVYFTRPILILFASYFVVKRLRDKSFVYNIIVLVALFFALRHLFVILVNIPNIDSYVAIRSLGGKQNHIEMVSLIILLFTPFFNILKRYRKLIIKIIFLSYLLYISRTMYITLFIFFLGYKGYLFLNKRFLKGMLVFMLVGLTLGIVISNIDANRESEGFRAFIYKTQNSFSEIFVSIDLGLYKDRRVIWEHWRAYEAEKAIEQVNRGDIKHLLLGFGYGSKVKLDTWVILENIQYTSVPSIHNGFINVFFKTGILGLIFYVLFILSIFVNYQKFRTANFPNNIYNKLIVATSLYMLYNSFVITGFYRPGEFSMFLFGVLVASKTKSLKT